MQEPISLEQIIPGVMLNNEKDAEGKEKKAPISKRYEYLDTDSMMKILHHETGKLNQDDIFLEASDDYRCSICSLVFKDPVTDDCEHQQHTFCQKCLVRALASKKACPLSRKPMTNFNITINQELNEKVKALTCRCYYAENGCTWMKTFGELDKHLLQCEYVEYKCNKCAKLFSKSAIDEHIAICSERRIRCKMCKWDGILKMKEVN